MNHRYQLIFFGFLVSMLLLACFGCSNNGSKKQRIKREQLPVAESVQHVGNVSKVLDVAESKGNDCAANFSWIDETGKKVELKDYRGNVVLINFWATWCGPCKKELPDLISIDNELRGKRFKLIGVSADRGSDVVKEVYDFAQRNNLNYPIVVDEDYQLEKAFGNVRGYPTTFLVDQEGKIVKTYVGARTKDIFMPGIAQVLR